MFSPQLINLINPDVSECNEFFSIYNSPEYKEEKKQNPLPFLSKISYASSRGAGVEVLHTYNEMRVRRKYSNGKLCGQIVDNLMTQRFISNPLLLNNHKFDFRIYILIASVNPLIVYYHDGFTRNSLLNYSKNGTTVYHFSYTLTAF